MLRKEVQDIQLPPIKLDHPVPVQRKLDEDPTLLSQKKLDEVGKKTVHIKRKRINTPRGIRAVTRNSKAFIMRKRAETYFATAEATVKKVNEKVAFTDNSRMPTEEELKWAIQEIEYNQDHNTRYASAKQVSVVEFV